ncbi:hypothetical protein MYX84_04210 [Acidobacteria bacterium AH-259-O06]|nr:hypothetical protein [Acidobacteria bacterium AH-259-L09]MDA2929146.1 hypothetical protein [Acidobacteria bacterium AH-259-O06]
MNPFAKRYAQAPLKKLALASVMIVAVMVFLGGLFITTNQAYAIPANARRYGITCLACHLPPPKLNDFGNRFRDNGYEMRGILTEQVLKRINTLNQGVKIKEVTREELEQRDNPAKLASGFWPVALRASLGNAFKSVDKLAVGASPQNPATSPSAPLARANSNGVELFGVDLLSLGAVAQNVSFNLTFYGIAERNLHVHQGWVRLSNLFGTSLVNVKLGKVILDLPFSEDRSPTYFVPYVVYRYRPGLPYIPTMGLVSTNFTSPLQYANRDTFRLRDEQPAVELMGHKDWAPGKNFRYVLTALLTENIDIGSRTPGFYGHLTQSFGGEGFNSGHRIGIYGLYGEAPTENKFGLPGTGTRDRPFFRLGFDLSTAMSVGRTGNLNLFGVYMYGEDNPSLITPLPTTISGGTQRATWQGWFGEANLVKPPYMFIYRYDGVRNIRQGIGRIPNDFNDVDSHTLAIRRFVFLPAFQAVVFHADYSITTTRRTALNGSNQTFHIAFVGFDFLF